MAAGHARWIWMTSIYLVMAMVRSFILVGTNPFIQCLYSSLGPAKVIDAADIIDVIGRVPDRLSDGSHRWAVVQRPGTIIRHEHLNQTYE